MHTLPRVTLLSHQAVNLHLVESKLLPLLKSLGVVGWNDLADDARTLARIICGGTIDNFIMKRENPITTVYIRNGVWIVKANDSRDGGWMLCTWAIPTGTDVEIEVSRSGGGVSFVRDDISGVRIFDGHNINAFSALNSSASIFGQKVVAGIIINNTWVSSSWLKKIWIVLCGENNAISVTISQIVSIKNESFLLPNWAVGTFVERATIARRIF